MSGWQLASDPLSKVMADPPDVPEVLEAGGWWQRRWFLAGLLFAFIVLNNSEFLFQAPHYEADDYAANSLQVLKAKQFREPLGHYCRFGFHHPGPAFFYVFGWGEMLFFDALRIVPTPFNGQLIALYALSAFFFAASLALISARVGKAAPWFIGIALLFSAWHFGAVGKFFDFVPGELGLLSPWPPAFIILPFLCFLVAAASVAAGNGKDLPLMVLAGCFLVHGYVGMPLFVGPITLVAYGGLACEVRRIGGRPWRLFARQHWLAAGTIALFLLPITIDLFTAHPSNLERITHHLRTGYGEGKGLWESVLYFLHFAAYAALPSRWPIPTFETFDGGSLRSFLLLHWRAYALWVGSIFLWAALTRAEGSARTTPAPIARFRRCLYLVLGVATVLSLLWGCIQEGPLYDYNSLFNFAIYYGWLLVIALSAAVWIENRFSLWRAGITTSAASRWATRIRVLAVVALFFAMATAFRRDRRYFRATSNRAEQTHFAATIERALALDPARPKFFNFDWQANAQATRTAVYLERRGIEWWVRENWPLQFGADRVITPGKTNQPLPTSSSSFWRFALHSNPFATEGDPNAVTLPLTNEVDLVIHPGK
jgi:hypothetical protein